MPHPFIALLTLFIVLAVAAVAPATADDELPDARDLINRYIEAVGGREALLNQTEATMTGSFEMAAMGLSAPLVVASRPPADRVVRVEMPQMGEIISGYTRDVAWSVDPFMGARLLDGAELASLKEQSEPGALLRDEGYVASVQTVERTTIGGEECFRVRIEWQSGREGFDCYAVDSGLLVGMETTQTTAMGEITSVSEISDYQRFDDVLIPTRMEMSLMGQRQVLAIDSVEFGTPDPALFELPPAIEALIEAEQAQEQAEEAVEES